MKPIAVLFTTAILVTSSATFSCPQNYALIAPLAPYTTSHFLISQYEMRQGVNNLPEPTITGIPWHLPRNQAEASCQSIGMRLPTNAEWQTMARQAEYVAANWTGGQPGAGFLKADITYLPNGSVLFNLGDSVWEQVAGDLTGETGNGGPIYLVNGITNPATVTVGGVSNSVKYHFGPQDGYVTYPYNPGLGILTNRYSQSIMRGGDDEEPGFFGTAVNHGPTDMSNDIGFRCVTSISSP